MENWIIAGTAHIVDDFDVSGSFDVYADPATVPFFWIADRLSPLCESVYFIMLLQ